MATLRLLALVVLTGLAAPSLASERIPPAQSGPSPLIRAFDPDRIFAGDLRPGSDDALILTVFASARDDYAPDYSLAIAYRCLPTEIAGRDRCGYVARTLRVAPGEDAYGHSLRLNLSGRARDPANADDLARLLDEGALQWLEADVGACERGIFAMDSVRVADWNPDVHTALQAVEDRDVILHPALIRVRMTGFYTTSRYEGWVLADGVPAAVRQLGETLEPCWRPATSPRPWER